MKSIRSISLTLIDILSTGESICCIASSPTRPQSIFSLNLENLHIDEIATSPVVVDPAHLSKPKLIEFTSRDEESIYGIYYPPYNTEYEGNEATLPPLILKIHGGPTAHAPFAFDLVAQYFATRGFGFFLINPSGSTGFGREYRNRIHHQWGEKDVSECIDAMHYFINQSMIDPKKIAARGSSSGGFMALLCLESSPLFQGGVSYYGISDLEHIVKCTHKFESQYFDFLIGPYPRMREKYHRLSPLHNVDRIQVPLLILQGGKDPIVPKEQSEMLVNKLKEKGVFVEYIYFEEESHSFKLKDSITHSLEKELLFYQKIFGLI